MKTLLTERNTMKNRNSKDRTGAVSCMLFSVGILAIPLLLSSCQSVKPWECAAKDAEMVYIPEGEFRMGTSEDDAVKLAGEYGVHPDMIRLESPQKKVNLKAFWIDRFPVTNRQYLEFLKATGRPISWPEGKIPEGLEDCAAVNISWPDAVEYAKWAGKRLPSAEEWEKAARGTDGRLYPWGNEWDEEATHRRPAELFMPPELCGFSMPVACYPKGASPYGVMDMCGNVPEMTSTLTPGWNWENSCHIVKGASAACTQKSFFRCASVAFSDTWRARGGKGFRCAKDADAPPPSDYKLKELSVNKVPEFPQPASPREDLYLKEPITLHDCIKMPFLPDGRIGFIAPEGAHGALVKTGEPDKSENLMKNYSGLTEVSADGRRWESIRLVEPSMLIMRAVFESDYDHVDYTISFQNISDSETRKFSENTCCQVRPPYFYDQEDMRTFIVTDTGLTPLIKCQPFSIQNPLYRGWPILPKGESPKNLATPARLPFVCTVSTDGKWTMAITQADGDGFARNANYSCLHLSKSAAEIVPPGGISSTLKRIYILRGGAQDALDRYNKDIASGDFNKAKEAKPATAKEKVPRTPPELPLSIKYSPIDISKYANRGFIDETANDGKGGWSDQGPDCDLREFPTGLQKFNGVLFLVGQEPKTCVVLSSGARPFPELQPESVAIPVDKKALGFYFLHAGTYTGYDVQIGKYQIQYEDGTVLDIPLVGDQNLHDWISLPGPFPKEKSTWSRIAWTGSTRASFPNVSVSQMLWVNPKPETQVKSITFENPAKKGCPILVGITAVERGDKPEAEAVADRKRAEELLAEGRAALDAGKNAEARELLKKSISINSCIEDGHRLLVEVCGRMKDEPAVLETCRAWADAGATDPMPYNRIGEMLEKKGDLQGALLAYRNSFRLDWQQIPVIRAKVRIRTNRVK